MIAGNMEAQIEKQMALAVEIYCKVPSNSTSPVDAMFATGINEPEVNSLIYLQSGEMKMRKNCREFWMGMLSI